jgi:hypothetical protein
MKRLLLATIAAVALGLPTAKAEKLTGVYCVDALILHDHPALARQFDRRYGKGEAKATLKLVKDVGVACE